MTENETRITACKKCGIRTRHERAQWESPSILFWILGRGSTKPAEGWQCTKCGRRRAVN